MVMSVALLKVPSILSQGDWEIECPGGWTVPTFEPSAPLGGHIVDSSLTRKLVERIWY